MRIQDRLNRLRNKRGFTLVELMIVVAIIGVLAALAIYGVRKYLANAKTAEARMGVGRLAKDAQLAYEKESLAAGIVQLTENVAIAHTLCPTATAKVPAAPEDIGNRKYQSTPDEWNNNGWACLKFTMSDPQYFQYGYTATTALAPLPSVLGNNFAATAQGDLDGDTTLSSFTIVGAIQESLSGELVLTLAPTIGESQPEE